MPTAPPTPPSISDIPSSVWYQHIHSLPLNIFIAVAVDANLHALTISGIPSREELLDAWENIKSEYAEAIGDSEQAAFIKLFKEINILQLKLRQIHLLIDTLRNIYYKPLADKLNAALQTSFDFGNCTQEQYLKLLQGCLNRSKGIKIDLDLKMLQMKAIEDKNGGGNPYTREYFISMLIVISNHAKYQVPDEVTVYEFCARVKTYSEYVKQVEKTMKK